MNKIIYIVLPLIFLSFLSGCFVVNYICIHNETTDTLVFLAWYENNDTDLTSERPFGEDYGKRRITILPFQVLQDEYSTRNLKTLFKNSDTLHAYLVHADTLRKHPLEEVSRRRLWLHRFELKREDVMGIHEVDLYYPVFSNTYHR